MTSRPRHAARSQPSSPSPRRALRSPPSISSLRGTASVSQSTLSAVPPRLHATPTTPSSAASSVINLDLTESILLRDANDDDDVAENDELIEGVFAAATEDGEQRKKTLRDSLRRTLSRRDPDRSLRPARWKGKSMDITEIAHSPGDQYPQRQYYVFTDAGKPVFASRPAECTEDLASITGVTSALISVFADNTLSPSPAPSAGTDKLRCINAGATRITFLLRPPLYFICVSQWKEPESVARMHLDYLHLQILSVITASQLRRIFERRTNFDLRRLLEGAETFLHTLLSRLQASLAFCATLGALSSLRLDDAVRNRAGDALVPNSKAGGLDILYTLLVAGDKVVTLVRPRRHSVHPTDLHIILNALHTPSVAATPASWLPMCLPKFNPQGFVHLYVRFLEHEQPGRAGAGAGSEDAREAADPHVGGGPTGAPPNITISSDGGSGGGTYSPGSTTAMAVAGSDAPGSEAQNGNDPQRDAESREAAGAGTGLALVIVSGGGEFDAVRRWSESVAEKLETTGLMALLRAAVQRAPYGCAELGVPGLRHFLYKSRVHVQATYPVWDEEYQTPDSQRRIITLYQVLHDAIHAKSGQASTLKLQYIRSDKEAVMGWITQPFELYIVLSPRLPKTAAVGAANAVARWVKREEARLFLRDAPVF